VAEPWFNENLFGALWGSIAGGGGGTLVGLWGALVGTLAPKGKGRAWLLGAGWVLVGLGVLSLGFGLYALAVGQPYGIWYGPCLTGVVVIVVTGGLIPVARKRYAEAEARRLEGEAFRGH
jgi:hypothetical protein